MNKFIKRTVTSTAVLVAITLAGCARFDERMQAEGDFEYQDVKLLSPYQTGSFSTDESRPTFNLPVLTDAQIDNGFSTEDVDIRPPVQLMPVIDGISLTTNENHTSVLFKADDQSGDIKSKVWSLLNSYLAEKNIDLVKKDASSMQIETTEFAQLHSFSTMFNTNEQLRNKSLRLTVKPQVSLNNAVLDVELLTYSEFNDDKQLKFNMTKQRKKNIELRFVNDLLAFAYQQKKAEEHQQLNSQPLTIKLGFDENHQNFWIVENTFAETWQKVSDLLNLLHFTIVETDRNLGYVLANFSTPDEEYWQENNLNPFELKSGEYFIQLGKMDENTTSISWLDKDKKPIKEQKVTDMYLSITDQVRSVILKKDKQTKSL